MGILRRCSSTTGCQMQHRLRDMDTFAYLREHAGEMLCLTHIARPVVAV